MCDQCRNKSDDEIAEELSEMEADYLGGTNGALRIKRVLTGMSKGMLAIGQELEVATITEDGVTKETKQSVIYLTPAVLNQILVMVLEDDEDG